MIVHAENDIRACALQAGFGIMKPDATDESQEATCKLFPANS
jgi:hypothetical protein